LFWFNPNDKWKIEVAVTNITDEAQEGNLFRDIGFLDIPGGGGTEVVAYNPPKMRSLRLAYKF